MGTRLPNLAPSPRRGDEDQARVGKQRLVAARADLISIGPVPITDGGAFEGVVVLYLRDPDGNVIELIERPAPA